MNAEITQIKELSWLEGWVLFDGECPACRELAVRFEKILTRRGFDPVPWQSPWIEECLGLRMTKPPAGLRVLTMAGDDFFGVDAVVYLSRHIWWARPFGFVLKSSPGRFLLRLIHDSRLARCWARSSPRAATRQTGPAAMDHGR